MRKNQRQYIRQDVELACTWQGDAETSEACITELSLDGCFVESQALPVIGEEIELSVSLDTPVSMIGSTVYTLGGIGFGVRFKHMDVATIECLATWLARPPSAKASTHW